MVEYHTNGNPVPQLSVYTGPMFAGKTETLAEFVRTENTEYYRLTTMKCAYPVRNGFLTHGGKTLEGFSVSSLGQIDSRAETILLDEAQFADPAEIRPFLERHANGRCLRILVACLDTDFMGNQWEASGTLLCFAHRVFKLSSKCAVCGMPARLSHRTTDSRERLEEGNHYEPRCHRCHPHIPRHDAEQ